MGKRLMLILACALLVGLVALPAFAEVQNVKVSGDITALGISRSHFKLGTINRSDDKVSHAASITRLRVDADLTEKVGATIRLINERDWGGNDSWNRNNDGVTAEGDANTVATVNLDLAYISLKEFLYSPLTVIIGRQELHFGNDFIIGDPDTNNVVSGTSLTDADLSKKKAFDAIRGTLNYDPLVIDILWAKIQENTVEGGAGAAATEKDDIDLFGVNARYDFGGKYKTIGELYYFGKVDNTPRDNVNNTDVKSVTRTDTFGGRAEITPMERLNLQAELAFQGGKINNNDAAQSTRKHRAMAAQGIGRYALNMKYNPVLMAIYSFYSGDRQSEHINTSDGGWDPMFENQTSGHIINVLFNVPNSHILNLRGSIVPMEDVTLTLDYVWLNIARDIPATVNGAAVTTTTTYDINHTAITPLIIPGNKHLGDEIDLTLKYDYTEDVQLGLMAGVFFPGDVFRNNPDNVGELIASCTVAF